MQKVWDGSNWVTNNALKVWSGSAWVINSKLKARTSISWLPTSVSDSDVAQVVKWSIEAPTPPPPPPPVTHPVPDLDLLDSTQLDAALSPLNFGYTIAGYETTSVLNNDNKVVINSQIPATGESLAEFSNVSIRLYNFVQPTTTVPNIDNYLTSAANTAITNANLTVGSPLTAIETYDSFLIGKVVAGSQFPAANTIQDTGTPVIYDFYVQQAFVTVPNLVNTNEDSIYTTLSTINLSVGTRTAVGTTNPALDGKIKSTSPVSGTQVQIDSNVNYEVYTHTLAVIPNLNGLTQPQADAALEAAYLNTGNVFNFETTVVADENKVKLNSQSPAAGTTVNRDSLVNFTINVPNTTTTVPNFSLLTTAQVNALLLSSELNALFNQSVYTSDTNLQFKVVANSQSPTAGTQVAIFSTVSMNLYLPFPQYTVPTLTGATPSSGPIDANFTWGSNNIASTSTQSTADFGKVASQSPTAGSQAQAGAINYGVYADGRPTVGNYVGSARTTAQSNIQAIGLNYSVSYQNQSFNGQATADTVASQSPANGTRLASGSTVSLVVWNAYVPQPVTRTATVYVGDDALNGWMNSSGQQFSTGASNLDWKWQAHYKLLNTTGTRVATSTYARMTGYVGYQSATNGKQAMTFRQNPTEVDSWIKANITNNAAYSVGNVDFVFSVGADGNSGKLWYLDWMGSTTSAPTTYTDSSRTNTQAISGISNNSTYSITLNSTMKLYSWTNGYGLGVAAGTTASNASVTYGSISWAYFAAQISWTEYV